MPFIALAHKSNIQYTFFMQLNLRTDYALRMLMALAATDRTLSIDWIAQRYAISRNHLAKVAQDLAAAGFVDTQRGRGGGLRLARPAADINVGAVVRSLEKEKEALLEELKEAKSHMRSLKIDNEALVRQSEGQSESYKRLVDSHMSLREQMQEADEYMLIDKQGKKEK